MAFTEPLKRAVRKKAHHCCCICKSTGSVEIHHIIPQAEGGPDTEDNAAPLCSSCHEMFGANPQKRKFIKETRDDWYEICEMRFASDAARLEKILGAVQEIATKDELNKAVDRVLSNMTGREQYEWQINQMQQRIQGFEDELQAKSLTLLQLQKRAATTELGAQIAMEMASDRGDNLDRKATGAYGEAIRTLTSFGNVSPEEFAQLFKDAFSGGPAPEDAVHKALYYLSVQYKCFIHTTWNVSCKPFAINGDFSREIL